MRNLICIQHAQSDFEGDLPATASAWDTASDTLICALGPTKEKKVIELRKYVTNGLIDNGDLVASWDAPSPLPELEVDRIISMRHLVKSETICLVLAGGDIVVVKSDPLPSEEKIEIVGSVDVGATAAAWSPNEDLLAVTTRANTLLLMTVDFENVANVSFSSDDEKLSKHVSVGWGKSETQFKGKRAKALRDPTMPEKLDEGTLSPYDQNETTISWRGDGAFFAVNSRAEVNRRMIRVYSQEGILDSVSEPTDGLESALSWRPAGNLLGSIQRFRNHDINIIFFERNGLRHGEFDLRLVPEEDREWDHAMSLSWNIDSTVLAVNFVDRVQLWTIGNYHYYLKQEILFPYPAVKQPCCVSWHPEEALRLAVVHRPKEKLIINDFEDKGDCKAFHRNAIHFLNFIFDVSRGPSTRPHDQGMVLVADGRMLRVTPLRWANVPPPMALHEVDLPNVVRDCAVNISNSKLAVLLKSSTSVFDISQTSTSDPEPKLASRLPLPKNLDLFPLQVSFSKRDDVWVLFSDLRRGINCVYNVSQLLQIFSFQASKVARLLPVVGTCRILIENDHNILDPNLGDCDKETNNLNTSGFITCSLPAATPWVEAIADKENMIAFGLTTNGVLYANGRQLARSCTSFIVTEAHLIFTSSDHLLKFVHLSDAVENLQIPPDQPETDERCRSIERGAKLITVIPSAFSLVLQMPRGNLETIYPRALVLAGIRRCIEAREYYSAFMACRNHRVDMNILHDHDSEQFLANVGAIIDQLQNAANIDLFLTQLRDEDVCQSMYRETLPINQRGMMEKNPYVNRPKTSIEEQPLSKVDRICDAFLGLFPNYRTAKLQNIITAHLCKSTPDIEAGLKVIAALNEENSDSVESAVEHICFLADVNAIYDIAVGMYNLKLALLVAQQSQKDPREYLPYLQGLQDKSEYERKYQVDDDLGRHSRALAHLHSLRDVERLKAYTQKHKLYTEALELYKYNANGHSEILRLYADFLYSTARYKEAAIAFESLSDHSRASEAYRATSLWRESLACASISPSSTASSLTDLATSLADALEEAKDYSSAATIHLDHLSDVEGSIRCLCRGYSFAEATRVAALKKRSDLIEIAINPGLGEGSASLTELTRECREQLGAQVPRIKELRAAKAKDPLGYLDPNPTSSTFAAATAAGEILDDISIAPSQTSTANQTFLTRYTARGGTNNTLATGTSRKTSKNRRREERKRARGKKGTVYEEEYLVGSVGRLVERVNRSAAEVRATVEGLCRRAMWERARVLEGGWVGLVKLCEESTREVFAADGKFMAGDGVGGGERRADGGQYRPRGADGVLSDSLEEEWRKQEPPVVDAYERSALLR